jgi:hypothetical protein
MFWPDPECSAAVLADLSRICKIPMPGKGRGCRGELPWKERALPDVADGERPASTTTSDLSVGNAC